MYHGIILYNPTTECVNYPIKDEKHILNLLNTADARRHISIQKFVENENEKLDGHRRFNLRNGQKSLMTRLKKIGRMYDEYKDICALQYEFIENHEEISDNVFEVTYSDGSKNHG
ncbi:MAG: hypothetical protein L6V93_22015 [Clostridiales bacterium]|nr:MAG: hypothetical protein L6V93_22015 [Clostridiales bacterium]